MTSVKLEQLKKQERPNIVTLFGIIIVVRPLQLSKQDKPNVVTDSGRKFNDVNL